MGNFEKKVTADTQKSICSLSMQDLDPSVDTVPDYKRSNYAKFRKRAVIILMSYY